MASAKKSRGGAKAASVPGAMPTPPRVDPDLYRFELARIGVGYYISGREAARLGLLVSGNLLHHAIEMFLKAALLKDGVPISDLKDVYQHDLEKLWKVVCGADLALSAYAAAISGLHRFEELRYPDRILAKGMTWNVGWNLPNEKPRTKPTLRHYELDIVTMDALVLDLFTRASLDPRGFRPTSADAFAALMDKNLQAARWG